MGYFIVLAFSWVDSLISKGKGILVTLFAFSWMAYLGGTASPITTTDYASYEYYYNLLVNGLPGNRLEWLYTYLSEVAISHGLSYAQFRLWLLCTTFFVLFIAVIRLTKKPVVFAAIFIIFPFFNEVTQVRSFVAYTIVLFGLSFMRRQVHIKEIFFFELFVLLAMGFHSSAGIFLLLPIMSMLIHKRGISNAFVGVTMFSTLISGFLMLMSSGSFFVNLIGSALDTIVGPQISATFLNLMSHSHGSKVLFGIVFFAYVAVIYIINFYITDNSSLMYLKDDSVFKITFSLVLFIELLVPLLLISRDLVRFPRFGFEIEFLLMGTILFILENKGQPRMRFLILSIICIAIGGWRISYVYGPPFWNSIPYIAHLISES